MVIDHGIQKRRRGVETSEPVTRFFHEFAKLGEIHKLFGVSPGSRYAAGANDFWYSRDMTLEQCSGWEPSDGSQGAWLRVDFASGQVVIDLVTICRVADVQMLRAEFSDEWPIFAQGGQSVHFGVELGPVDPGQPIDLQQREASDLVEAAARMSSWSHRSGRARLDRIVGSAR